MDYVYLISTVFLQSALSVLGGFFSRKNRDKKDSGTLYTLLLILSVFSAWIIMFIFDSDATFSVIPYSVLFALGYATALFMMTEALKCGPVVLTSLILQLSLIGATIWGFFFWNDAFTPMVGIGLGLVAASLWLCLYTGKKESQKISLKWLVCVSLMFIGNAVCTIVQKNQQLDFDGKYGNFTMMVATGLSVIAVFILYLKSDKRDSKEIITTSWIYPVCAGIMNALANLMVILLATSSLSPSLVYPVISIGALSVTTVFSVLIFKEKMKWWRWCGVAVGAVAVVLLSI